MTRTKNRTILLCMALLSLAPLVSGCGGGAVDAVIGVTVTGLTAGDAVNFYNNNADPIHVSANGYTAFDIPIQSGSTYSVTVAAQPYEETCVVANGSGTVDQNGDAVDVLVNCAAN